MANRETGYGMTAELKEKQASKYDPQLEGQARTWLQTVVGEPFPSGSFHEALKDGVYLCKAMNKLKPGSVPKINTGKMAFKMMENIGRFLESANAYGLPKADSFQTVDLYENQNIVQVVTAIHALSRVANKKGFGGPVLGPKEATKNVRQFDSDEQKKASSGVIGLQMGTNRGASQKNMTAYGTQRQIL